jgi:hypothetical protein
VQGIEGIATGAAFRPPVANSSLARIAAAVLAVRDPCRHAGLQPLKPLVVGDAEVRLELVPLSMFMVWLCHIARRSLRNLVAQVCAGPAAVHRLRQFEETRV